MNGKRINEEITGSELCIEFLNCLKLQLKIICIGITYLKKVIRYKEKLEIISLTTYFKLVENELISNLCIFDLFSRIVLNNII